MTYGSDETKNLITLATAVMDAQRQDTMGLSSLTSPPFSGVSFEKNSRFYRQG
jgi:hypothetical protein